MNSGGKAGRVDNESVQSVKTKPKLTIRRKLMNENEIPKEFLINGEETNDPIEDVIQQDEEGLLADLELLNQAKKGKKKKKKNKKKTTTKKIEDFTEEEMMEAADEDNQIEPRDPSLPTWFDTAPNKDGRQRAIGILECHFTEGFLGSIIPTRLYPPDYYMENADGMLERQVHITYRSEIINKDGKIFLYNLGKWELLNDNELTNLAQEYLFNYRGLLGIDKFMTIAKIQGCSKILKATLHNIYREHHQKHEKIPESKYIFFQNEDICYSIVEKQYVKLGNLETSEGMARLHNLRRSFFNYTKLDYNYNTIGTGRELMANAVKFQESEWSKFLNSIFNKENGYSQPIETIERLQEWAGYSLTESTMFQKCLMLHGEGANGKSVFLNILGEILNKNCSKVELSDLFGQSNFYLIELLGKTANISNDANTKDLAKGKFKAATSGEDIHADIKFETGVKFPCRAKFLFSVNRFGQTKDLSEGYFRRFDVLEFKKIFTESERDYNLPQKLEKEHSLILAWALDGLTRLLEQGRFTVSQDFNDATREFRESQDSVGEFISEHYTLTGKLDDIVSAETVRELYTEWCTKKGDISLSGIAFGREMKAKGLIKKRVRINKKRNFVYVGIIKS